MLTADRLEDLATAETDAALALGRLDGTLRALPASASRILAGRVLRETLIAALRQEGHIFSDHRFFAWFAGLVALGDASDLSHTDRRPPRAMSVAILTALSHNSWPPLAALATELAPAFLAIGDGYSDDAHHDAHALIEEARQLLTKIHPETSPRPFDLLKRIHRLVAESTEFAPKEHAMTALLMRDMRIAVQRPPAPSPRWALEICAGELWHAAGLISVALPLVGLIRLDALVDDDLGEARHLRADNLRACAGRLLQLVDEARTLADVLTQLTQQWRSTSRAPALFELLAGFGALRSAQIERVLGATRLGVRKMLDGLKDSGALHRSTVAAAHLYEITPSLVGDALEDAPTMTALSSEAVSEFNTTMANVDAILARHGVDLSTTEAPSDD